ncbi:hypothetical protein BS17DRAFT_703821 [Gyrodon lividus]|nr:hypothetical protein BS17DRAFT_703821 [Gyrodon lividus]
MTSHQRRNSKVQVQPLPVASSPESSTSSTQHSTYDAGPDAPPGTFKRLRSSFEQSLKTATRSKAKPSPVHDDFATISAKGKRKDKEKYGDTGTKEQDKDKARPGMLKRLESKVGLRWTGRDSATTSSTPIPYSGDQRKESRGHVNNVEKDGQARVAGLTSFMTPSLRQASVSSPALHLSSQAIPSPNSQPAVMINSSSPNAALISPTRDRTRRASMQPTTREISAPQPLTPRREHRDGTATPDRNRAGKSRPPPIFTPPPSSARASMDTPRKSSDLPSPPDSPSPPPGGRGQFGTPVKRPGAASATDLPLNSPSSSPTPGRAVSPSQARTPTRRVVTPISHRGLTSTSATHLPSGSVGPRTSPTSPKRLSVDTPRRPSAEIPRRPSAEIPRRGSMDTPRGLTSSPPPRATSPSSTARSRATSPSQRPSGYVHSCSFNMSAASLISPSTPEQRELIRTATSLLCKELRKPPPHLSRSENAREWAEVEVRLQPLVRLERIWGKSGALPGASSSQVAVTGLGSVIVSNAGEERERKLFCEALRDGIILCQLMNKHPPSIILRIDPREDGFKRTSNISKFLAACSSHGVPSDDLFYRDDLVEATPEALCRVARTIIALLKLFEKPAVDRSKVIAGQGKKGAAGVMSDHGPYSQKSLAHAVSSTPNLSPRRSVSPITSHPEPGRKCLTPPVLPPSRPDSPQSGTSSGTARHITSDNGCAPSVGNSDRENDDVPPIRTPSPKSPLRTRSKPKHTDDSGADLLSDYGGEFPIRQSRTSSNLTENTAYSSLFDIRRNSSAQNKFGTIRTVTTDATSLGSEVPSFTRTEASSVAASMAEEMGRRRNSSGDGARARERRPSEPAVPDLVSLAEEEENSACGSSSRDTARAKSAIGESQREREPDQVRVRLGKGKWPDDFLDAFQAAGPSRPIPIKIAMDRAESPLVPSPLSVSPTRKLSIVGASRHNDSSESIPRRPTHRSRHSVDAPILMPKESILRRDVSPDSPIAGSPGSRVILRRQSARNGARRNGIYAPRSGLDDPDRDGDLSVVPFPRAVSGEHSARASPSSDSPQDQGGYPDVSHVRDRFQSEVDDPRARRRSRPNSHDELGRPRRFRYERMISLGVASNNGTASELPGSDSMDGSVIRQTIVVEEDGKLTVHFQLGNCIGRGQFGIVYRALNLTTGQMVAVKRIRLEGLKEEEVTQLMNEVDLMKSLSHPSIVKYEGMVRDEDFLNIILEYAESGSLGQTLKAFGRLNERLVASYVVKILEGLHYLHRCQVVHCDLKAANILTTKTGNIKLSDFGVSLNLRAMERDMNNVAGTPNWMAPEVIELKGASTKSDIWSLGCTVIELLTGRPPYGEIANSMTAVMFRIVEDEMPPLPDDCSDALLDFLQQCFHKDPQQRPDARKLCEHPWLKKNWDALKELRPQDSIPFLRRVSADLHKTDVAEILAHIDTPIIEAPAPETPAREEPSSSSNGKLSFGLPSSLPDDTPFSPRDHTFVKTTFGKRNVVIAMVCRVCLGSVKKSAVICEQCSLIAHSKCARDAPPTCDLRSQLLLYAQYAEKVNPMSVCSHPLDAANGLSPPAHLSTTAPSEVSFAIPSPLPSTDLSPTHTPGQSALTKPPTGFKIISGFGRSRSSLSIARPSSPSPNPPPNATEDRAPRKSSKLRHNVSSKERPHSLSSDSTAPKSMRTADSQSSRQEHRKSFLSIAEPDADIQPRVNHDASEAVPSQMAPTGGSVLSTPPGLHLAETVRFDVPGTLSSGPDRQKKRGNDKYSNCIVQ